jgi:hypothetical protein
MRTLTAIALALSGAAAAALLTLAAPRAFADHLALNGSFQAFSDGQWAKTNERYQDKSSVSATWSVTSSCSTYLDCTGTVSSDQGWSAPLVYKSGTWRVTHQIDHWLTCPDGTTYPGQQSFLFWPHTDNSPMLVGYDKTVAPSGACGVNRPVTIDISFKLTPR